MAQRHFSFPRKPGQLSSCLGKKTTTSRPGTIHCAGTWYGRRFSCFGCLEGIGTAGMKLTEAKLFPHLDNTPDSHKLRMVHSVTQYDRQNEARAERKGQKHNIYALGHYLAAADRVHDDLKAGVHPIQAVDNHFNDNLAMRLHKHLGTGKEQLSEADYEVAPVMRNFSGDRTGALKPVLEVPDGSRQRPEDHMQGLIDKIAVVCRSKAAVLKVLQRAPRVGFAIE